MADITIMKWRWIDVPKLDRSQTLSKEADKFCVQGPTLEGLGENKMKTTVVNLKKDKYNVYIGRPSIWGNPFVIGRDGNRSEVIDKYEDYIRQTPKLLELLPELKGKALGCYCSPKPCHGDVLVKLIKEMEKA